MKGLITSAIKKVTLEQVYKVVDERTEQIMDKLEEGRKRQEDDFRYIVQKMDNDIGQLRTEVNGKIDQLNQRIDTIVQMLMTIRQGRK